MYWRFALSREIAQSVWKMFLSHWDLRLVRSLWDVSILYWTTDVSKPCHQRWAISQEASLEIWVVPLDWEKGSILREREREREGKGRDTERIVPQQTDGPFSLIFLSYSYRKPRRGGKRMPSSFSPSFFPFSHFSCLSLPSFFISSSPFVHQSLPGVFFKKKKKKSS